MPNLAQFFFSISSLVILSVVNELCFRVSNNILVRLLLLLFLEDLFEPLLPDKLVANVCEEGSTNTAEKNKEPECHSVSFSRGICALINSAAVEFIVADAVRDRALIRHNQLLVSISIQVDDSEGWAGVNFMSAAVGNRNRGAT